LIAVCEGRPVGTATTIIYGKEVGWIGMMLVHPDFRKRGIARVLMDHCVEILRAAGVRSIKLDATPEGREVYLKLGFQDECRLTRYKGMSVLAEDGSQNIRAARAEDFERIVALDQSATGALRDRLLERLIAESSRALVYQNGNRVSGFGILRPGALASYLGPVIATEVSHAQQLASALASGEIVCDLPDQNEAAARWAKDCGFVPQRTLTRMYLGENISASAPESYFAIAGPELG
jgi:predicted GNAT family acetyltransferase